MELAVIITPRWIQYVGIKGIPNGCALVCLTITQRFSKGQKWLNLSRFFFFPNIITVWDGKEISLKSRCVNSFLT